MSHEVITESVRQDPYRPGLINRVLRRKETPMERYRRLTGERVEMTRRREDLEAHGGSGRAYRKCTVCGMKGGLHRHGQHFCCGRPSCHATLNTAHFLGGEQGAGKVLGREYRVPSSLSLQPAGNRRKKRDGMFGDMGL